MGYGYQQRDYEIIDYKLWEMEGLIWEKPEPDPFFISSSLNTYFYPAKQI